MNINKIINILKKSKISILLGEEEQTCIDKHVNHLINGHIDGLNVSIRLKKYYKDVNSFFLLKRLNDNLLSVELNIEDLIKYKLIYKISEDIFVKTASSKIEINEESLILQLNSIYENKKIKIFNNIITSIITEDIKKVIGSYKILKDIKNPAKDIEKEFINIVETILLIKY